jgi:hypothetical protein
MITKLEYYEYEYQRLNEMTSLLELSLWKARISSLDHGIMAMSGGNTKIKRDNMEFKLQCRISCGADHVIQNVLPYMCLPILSVPRSMSDEDDNNFDSESDDNNNFDSAVMMTTLMVMRMLTMKWRVIVRMMTMQLW